MTVQSSYIQLNPDFLNLQGKEILVRKIGKFEKSGIKLHCLSYKRKRFLARVMDRIKEMRV